MVVVLYFDTMEKQDQISEKLLDTSCLEKSRSRWDQISWFMVLFGFISILTAGLFFYLQRNHPLHYRTGGAEYTLNANKLGQYFLMFGIVLYFLGRIIRYYQRFQRRAESNRDTD